MSYSYVLMIGFVVILLVWDSPFAGLIQKRSRRKE